MDKKYIKYCIYIFGVILLIHVFMNKTNIEEFEAPISTGATAFCESYKGSSAKLNTGCAKLTQKNCNETSCCVFANNKCVAGNANGPTYNTGKNGQTISSTYYFQNQCFGANCPSV